MRFSRCSRCRRLTNSGLSHPRPNDPRLEKLSEADLDNLAGACESGCEGLCFYLDDSYNEEAAQGVALARRVSDAVNRLGDDVLVQAFVLEMSRQHRTLQQGYGRLLVESIREFARMEKDGCFDGRNEATVKLCKDLMPIIEKKGNLPLI